MLCSFTLLYALSYHRVDYLGEACNVCAGNIVSFHAVFACSFVDVVVDASHDSLELCVNFVECPAESFAVL